MHFSIFCCFGIWTLSYLLLGLCFNLNYAICFWLFYDICDYLVMGHVFYDIFSIINVSCMQLKFNLDLPIQKYCVQTGSYADDIGILLLWAMRYTSLDPT